jgi:hypothetical protein
MRVEPVAAGRGNLAQLTGQVIKPPTVVCKSDSAVIRPVPACSLLTDHLRGVRRDRRETRVG